jgi:predicted DNA-binding WGR domain protein
MTKTRLEIDGRPGSFFEAEVKGSELHIAVGPRGRNIAAKVRPFPSEAAAKAELERLAGLHRTKGYVDAVEAAPPRLGIAASGSPHARRKRATRRTGSWSSTTHYSPPAKQPRTIRRRGTAMLRDSKLAKRVQLVTTPPDGARAARYAHPQQVQRMPLDLPRGGEPPEVKQS